MSKPLYGRYVFIFTDDLGETEFRHLEEGEFPVLVELRSGLSLPPSWGEALSPVNYFIVRQPKGIPWIAISHRRVSIKSLHSYLMVKASLLQSEHCIEGSSQLKARKSLKLPGQERKN